MYIVMTMYHVTGPIIPYSESVTSRHISARFDVRRANFKRRDFNLLYHEGDVATVVWKNLEEYPPDLYTF